MLINLSESKVFITEKDYCSSEEIGYLFCLKYSFIGLILSLFYPIVIDLLAALGLSAINLWLLVVAFYGAIGFLLFGLVMSTLEIVVQQLCRVDS